MMICANTNGKMSDEQKTEVKNDDLQKIKSNPTNFQVKFVYMSFIPSFGWAQWLCGKDAPIYV